jgi:predicted DNA-binding transcriptional regulator AlpA
MWLRERDLRNKKRIPYSRNQLADLIKHGLFPPPVRFVPNGIRFWDEEIIDQYIAEVKAQAAIADDPDTE